MTDTLRPDEVHAITVGELFREGADTYSIPLYQRNYTWGEEQIHRLVHDILDEAERGTASDYFLGNLVVAPPAASDGPFDVIDGQQRLTTLYILLARLRALPETRSLVEQVQPPVYEAREKATRALRSMVDGAQRPTDQHGGEDSGILHAGTVIDQLLQDPRIAQRLLVPSVLDYLLNRVLLVRMPIDRTTDLNRYFEIMNTRGTQLSPVDIVKARLMRHLPDPHDRALLDQVWTACSDMQHYVVMSLTAGDTTWRSAVFGDDWQALPTRDFQQLRVQLVDSRLDPGLPGESGHNMPATAMTLDTALDVYSRQGASGAEEDNEADDRFTSQIAFPSFLLHVLAVRGARDDGGQDDHQLDDKQLVGRFAEQLGSMDDRQREAWVRRFTVDLLRTRCLFDQYILKRDATLTTTVDSTTDAEPGSWSLSRLCRGDYLRRDKVAYSPRYRPTFAESGSGPGSLQRRIVLLQSALRITYTSPRTMHWMTDVLRHVTRLADRGEPVTALGLLDRIESFALARLDEALLPRSGPTTPTPRTSPDGLPVGFALPRIVFTYLDYLLVEEMDEWDFTFAYRTSVEHFSPQLEDYEHASPAFHVVDRRLLDWLGNLALVTVSTNSKFSNYQPSEKANNHAARRQSLKLELMARQAQDDSWNDEDIKAHHHHMVRLLRTALANRPTTHEGQRLPATPTRRDFP